MCVSPHCWRRRCGEAQESIAAAPRRLGEGKSQAARRHIASTWRTWPAQGHAHREGFGAGFANFAFARRMRCRSHSTQAVSAHCRLKHCGKLCILHFGVQQVAPPMGHRVTVHVKASVIAVPGGRVAQLAQEAMQAHSACSVGRRCPTRRPLWCPHQRDLGAQRAGGACRLALQERGRSDCCHSIQFKQYQLIFVLSTAESRAYCFFTCNRWRPMGHRVTVHVKASAIAVPGGRVAQGAMQGNSGIRNSAMQRWTTLTSTPTRWPASPIAVANGRGTDDQLPATFMRLMSIEPVVLAP